ncbi:MAG TPA: phosphotransferase [Acidimicrobiia bacterium]|nr:phosphotransferase [Acidimicrobiia bacterium]
MSIPRTAADLTPAWCTEALGRRITSVESTPLGVGVGLVGQLFRVELAGPDGSSVLIAKLAAPTDETRFVATVLNMYGREVGFYTELSGRTAIGHPACHYAAHDPATQDTVLLLEDVAPRGRAFDQVAGCTVSEARPAIRTLARLHACFWDDPALAEVEWLPRLCDDPYPGAVAMAYELAWPRFQELFPDAITPAVRRFGDEFPARIPALFAKLSEPPLVLAHADWRLDNLFFTPDGEVVAVDWQLVDRSVGPRDLAYLVTQSLNVDDRAGYEAAFHTYVADLAELGVEAPPEWAWEMYRYGAALGFAYPVIAAGALTIEDARHVEVCRALLDRSLQAIASLDAFAPPL